ncbi:phage integrase, N-terminal SAM-like domain protein [Rhodococcus sp. MTM3W5.2]|uniref:site-specific integrase n=1 Tax=Rhodococcus sp. MTM3W5.2 TaxID=1805827 RepID=UPI0009797A17|nr:phage integrase, N-terminal SAM-like domain protein [Rhodococcus sp. MTM3W5.2]
MTWARFLEECRDGRGLLEADRADLEAFHAARRLSEPPYRCSGEAWNRCTAALEKFYRWALAEGLLPAPPFGFTQQQPSGSVAVVKAREKATRHHGDVRFLSLPRYTGFRDVGLRGLLPTGAEDAEFVSRCGGRNAAFADLCVATGLRPEEANSLLACELPPIDTSEGCPVSPVRAGRADDEGRPRPSNPYPAPGVAESARLYRCRTRSRRSTRGRARVAGGA